MEQTLGHVTHAQNLRSALASRPEIHGTWMPISHDVNGLGRLVPAYSGNWSVRASLRARRQLGREQAYRPHDVLFFHTQVTALFSTSLMRRTPSVVSLDATPINYDALGPAYRHRPAGRGWFDSKKYDMNKDVFAAASALVAWSEWAATSLVDDYDVPRERIQVIAPGAARAYFRIGEARRASANPDRPVRLLFVGGDFARKGGPELVDAFRAARARERFELHVVTRDDVRPAPNMFVHRVGPNSAELFQLFREADLFVLPSHGECLSVALMEAAAASLPIISTAVGALGEAAIHGRNALVVRPGDVGSLRAALEILIEDRALRERFGRESYLLAQAKFDADRNNGLILDLVAALAPQSRARLS
jgi:glycosyltransferase involved in cell wall biosynthesis